MASDNPKNKLQEKEKFKADASATAADKNSALAGLLNAAWNDFEIVSIERIEIGSNPGWRVTYRE